MLVKYNKNNDTKKEFVTIYQPVDKIKKSENGKSMCFTITADSKIAVSVNGGALKDITGADLIKILL